MYKFYNFNFTRIEKYASHLRSAGKYNKKLMSSLILIFIIHTIFLTVGYANITQEKKS